MMLKQKQKQKLLSEKSERNRDSNQSVATPAPRNSLIARNYSLSQESTNSDDATQDNKNQAVGPDRASLYAAADQSKYKLSHNTKNNQSRNDAQAQKQQVLTTDQKDQAHKKTSKKFARHKHDDNDEIRDQENSNKIKTASNAAVSDVSSLNSSADSINLTGLITPKIAMPTVEINTFNVEATASLPIQTIHSEFNVPSSLSESDLSEALKIDDGKNKQSLASLHIANINYSGFVTNAQQKYSQALANRTKSLEQVQQQYYTASNYINQVAVQTDARHSELFSHQVSAIESSANNADHLVISAYRSAYHALRHMKTTVDAQLKQNIKSAEPQINAIIEKLATPRLNFIATAKKNTEDLALKSSRALSNWKMQLVSKYPIAGKGDLPAKNEAMQKKGLAIEKQVSQNVASKRKIVSNILQNNADITEKSISDSIKPLLNKHLKKMQQKGQTDIDKVFNGSLSSLRKNANSSRNAIAQMYSQALEQLARQRKTERSKLESQINNAQAQCKLLATKNHENLVRSANQLLPLYAETVNKFYENLVQSSSQGPDALSSAAKIGSAALFEQIRLADHSQVQLVQTVLENLALSFQQQRQKIQWGLDLAFDQLALVLNQHALNTEQSLMSSTKTSTASYKSYPIQVKTAALQWITPFAEKFAVTIQSLEAEFNKSKDAFERTILAIEKQYGSYFKLYENPGEKFKQDLTTAWDNVSADINNRMKALADALDAGIIDRIDEAGVTGAVRAITWAQGITLQSRWPELPNDDISYLLHIYHKKIFQQHNWKTELPYSLLIHLDIELDDDPDDKAAALAYIRGQTALGAKYELQASSRWYNDDEARIEATMRALDDSQLAQLHEIGADVIKDTADVLGGVDAKVFNEFKLKENKQGDLVVNPERFARADVHRLKTQVNNARNRNDSEAANEALTAKYQAADPRQWGGQEVSTEQRRKMLNKAFADINGVEIQTEQQPGETKAQAQTRVEREQAQAMFDFVSKDRFSHYHSGAKQQAMAMHYRMSESQKELSKALIFHGKGSVDEKAARILIESKRRTKAKLENIAELTFDPRLSPSYQFKNEKKKTEAMQAIMAERKKVALRFAEMSDDKSFGPEDGDAALASMVSQLQQGYKHNKKASGLINELVTKTELSAQSSANAMEIAISGLGTNKKLMDQMLKRMDRDQVDAMIETYNDGGRRNLLKDIGLYDQNSMFASDVSGDDKLDLEIKFMGVPRNEKEKAEVALAKVAQQKRETGAIGSFLASGSLSEHYMNTQTTKLESIIGSKVYFDKRGRPTWQDDSKFTANGALNVTDKTDFNSAVYGAEAGAQLYSAKVDQYANFATNAIMIAGAAVAAAASGGGASPLLLAAIAGATGAATIASKEIIKGGRYGWEEGVADLATTGVEALTAGVGAKLALMSRGLKSAKHAKEIAKAKAAVDAAKQAGRATSAGKVLALGKKGIPVGEAGHLTGNALVDQLLQNAVPGMIGAAANTAISDKNWDKGLGKGFENIFANTFKTGLTSSLNTSISTGFNTLGGRLIERAINGKDIDNKLLKLLNSGVDLTGSVVADSASTAVGLAYENARTQDVDNIFSQSMLEAFKAMPANLVGAMSQLHYQKKLAADIGVNLDLLPENAGDISEADLNETSAKTEQGRKKQQQQLASLHEQPDSDSRIISQDLTEAVDLSKTQQKADVEKNINSNQQVSQIDSDLHNGGMALTNQLLASDQAMPIGSTTTDLKKSESQPLLKKQLKQPNPDQQQALIKTLIQPDHNDGLIQSTQADANVQQADFLPQKLKTDGQSSDAQLRLDIIRTMLEEIQQKRAMSAFSGLLELDFQRLPDAVQKALKSGDKVVGQSELSAGVKNSIRAIAKRRFRKLLVAALDDPGKRSPLVQETLKYLSAEQIEVLIQFNRIDKQDLWQGKDPEAVLAYQDKLSPLISDFIAALSQNQLINLAQHKDLLAIILQDFEYDHFMTVADFPEFAHRADVGSEIPKQVHIEVAHGMDTSKAREAASYLDPDAELRPPFHKVVETEMSVVPNTEAAAAYKSKKQMISEDLRSSGDIDTDIIISMAAQLSKMRRKAKSARDRKNVQKYEKALEDIKQQLKSQRAQVSNKSDSDVISAKSKNKALEQKNQPATVEVVDQAVNDTQDQTAKQLTTQAQDSATNKVVFPDRDRTAAAVQLSSFRGDALDQVNPDAHDLIVNAVNRFAHNQLKPYVSSAGAAKPGKIQKLFVLTNSGQQVEVSFSLTNDLRASVDGTIPAARIHQSQQHPNKYTIEISTKLTDLDYERAIAHELVEIRHAHNKQSDSHDLLKIGGFNQDQSDAVIDLSAHDYARLEEFNVLQRQTAELDDQSQISLREHESQLLVANLGILDDNPQSRKRLDGALANIDNEQTKQFVRDQVEKARDNPFLKPLPDTKADRLQLVLDRLRHAKKIGLADQLLTKLAMQAKIYAAEELGVREWQLMEHIRESNNRRPVRRRRSGADIDRDTVVSVQSEELALIRQLQRALQIMTNSEPLLNTPSRLLKQAQKLDPELLSTIARIRAEETNYIDLSDFLHQTLAIFQANNQSRNVTMAELVDMLFRWQIGVLPQSAGLDTRLSNLATRAQNEQTVGVGRAIIYDHKDVNHPKEFDHYFEAASPDPRKILGLAVTQGPIKAPYDYNDPNMDAFRSHMEEEFGNQLIVKLRQQGFMPDSNGIFQELTGNVELVMNFDNGPCSHCTIDLKSPSDKNKVGVIKQLSLLLPNVYFTFRWIRPERGFMTVKGGIVVQEG